MWPKMWRTDVKNWLTGKDPDAGKDWRWEENGMTGWDGWMASPTWWAWVWISSRSWWWTGHAAVHGVTESDTTEQMNKNKLPDTLRPFPVLGQRHSLLTLEQTPRVAGGGCGGDRVGKRRASERKRRVNAIAFCLRSCSQRRGFSICEYVGKHSHVQAVRRPHFGTEIMTPRLREGPPGLPPTTAPPRQLHAPAGSRWLWTEETRKGSGREEQGFPRRSTRYK